MNLFEQFLLYLVVVLGASLYNPRYGGMIGYSLILGRILFTVGYLHSPNLRVPGALISYIAVFTGAYFAISACLDENLFGGKGTMIKITV